MSAYEDAYHKWVASLTPNQRAKLKAQGIDKPLDDHGQTCTPGNAEAVFATMGDEFDYDQFDKPSSSVDDEHDNIDEKAKAYGALLLCWVFQRLQRNRTEKEAALDKESLLFALGMEDLLIGKTETAIAERYGVKRATVSARVKSWQKLVGIKPSSFMKSENACKSYRKARINNLTKKESI
jgi:hypothetical protein